MRSFAKRAIGERTEQAAQTLGQQRTDGHANFLTAG